MPSTFRPRFFLTLPQGVAGGPGTELALSPADERHARLVLRARPGDACEMVLLTPSNDEQPSVTGALYAAHFVYAGRDLVVQLEASLEVPPPLFSLALLQALPELKSVDLVVEKGTEVGVDAFILFPAEGSPTRAGERAGGKLSRWRRIAEEAAKQSKQMAVPAVRLSTSAEEALELVSSWNARTLVLQPGARDPFSLRLKEISRGLEQAGSYGAGPGGTPDSSSACRSGPAWLALVVGAEGGWSEAELARFKERELDCVSLGRRILRAETAGPVAAAVARFTLGDA